MGIVTHQNPRTIAILLLQEYLLDVVKIIIVSIITATSGYLRYTRISIVEEVVTVSLRALKGVTSDTKASLFY